MPSVSLLNDQFSHDFQYVLALTRYEFFINFLDRRAAWAAVTWPDSMRSDAIIIGCLTSPRLPEQIACFVHEVAHYKEFIRQTAGRRRSYSLDTSPPASRDITDFRPEFAGLRRSYRIAAPIVSNCDHGLVVNALAQKLERHQMAFGSDTQRDLAIRAPGGNILTLFEVKTDLATSSIYQGIGQLMFHGARQDPSPQRVLVLPGQPVEETRQILDRLGVNVLVYSWQQNQPVFHNLDRIIGQT